MGLKTLTMQKFINAGSFDQHAYSDGAQAVPARDAQTTVGLPDGDEGAVELLSTHSGGKVVAMIPHGTAITVLETAGASSEIYVNVQVVVSGVTLSGWMKRADTTY